MASTLGERLVEAGLEPALADAAAGRDDALAALARGDEPGDLPRLEDELAAVGGQEPARGVTHGGVEIAARGGDDGLGISSSRGSGLTARRGARSMAAIRPPPHARGAAA